MPMVGTFVSLALTYINVKSLITMQNLWQLALTSCKNTGKNSLHS